jgi:hypothetical protein
VPEPSEGLKTLLDDAGRLIGQQVETARHYVDDANVLARLKADFGRGYLYGASEWLIGLSRLPNAERIYALPWFYCSVIRDVATALEIVGKRNADQWDAGCVAFGRRAGVELEKETNTRIAPMGLATFLRYGDPDARWELPMSGPPRR